MVNGGRQPIYLDYPVRPSPRYGWGRPPHPGLQELLASSSAQYAEVLDRLAPFAPGLKAIQLSTQDAQEPRWANAYISGLDAVTLYAFPKLFGSKRYMEIGSGNSTLFVRRSIRDHGLATRIISVDPAPRAHVDAICDEVVRSGIEDTPLEIFDSLEANDILMVDGSHRCFENSDVAVAFLEVFPRLKPGVLVFVHDIYLPDDYPQEWEGRFYSEQYLLAVLLLADRGRRYEIVFPAHFSAMDPQLGPRAQEFWRTIAPAGMKLSSNGFWIRVKA
ncbi:MAG: class I SAM-dependent methyltransferase [Gemmatimonadetes bacterium]|nr:class I SAM-dependent methyltransferase [Gemmatimonadota bacterium]